MSLRLSVHWLAMGAQALALAACRPASQPAAQSGRGPGTEASTDAALPGRAQLRREGTARETAIHFVRPGGKPFPYPLVRARVRGVETWLVLDSGASHTVLDVWLLEQLGVELSASDQPGEGHAGERVGTMLARSPHLELDGWGPLPGDVVLAVEFPEVFRRLGLGGVVSPQALAPPDTLVVVDLPASSLRLIPRSEASVRAASASLGPGRPCAVGGDPPGVVFLVDATVENQPVRLMVDSGSARSDLLSNSRAGRQLAASSTRGEASYTAGGRVEGRRLADARMRVGTVARRLDVAMMPGGPSGACPRDGHLGLDVLRQCVLFLAPDHFEARCGDS